MVSIGYFLSSEEFGPRELVNNAKLAQAAGFERLWISDHFHPWSTIQGQSPFVWSVVGALAEVTDLPVTIAVTCPTMRIHPAIVAQAAATAALQHEGRFVLGVGTGEALNEHILGDRWPPAGVRLEMLEESVALIRRLISGREVNHHGKYYTVENARLYSVPPEPVPIFMSAFGPRAIAMAGRIADGFICVKADSALINRFREHGGGDKPTEASVKVCYAPTREEGVRMAHKVWPMEHLPGELLQVLPTPRHFEQASTLITEQMIADRVPCGPDPEPYLKHIQSFVDAGYDNVYVQQIGPDQEAFFEFWANKIRPVLG
jgi:G6PDH family F420-dependent oxidoreductase